MVTGKLKGIDIAAIAIAVAALIILAGIAVFYEGQRKLDVKSADSVGQISPDSIAAGQVYEYDPENPFEEVSSYVVLEVSGDYVRFINLKKLPEDPCGNDFSNSSKTKLFLYGCRYIGTVDLLDCPSQVINP